MYKIPSKLKKERIPENKKWFEPESILGKAKYGQWTKENNI